MLFQSCWLFTSPQGGTRHDVRVHAGVITAVGLAGSLGPVDGEPVVSGGLLTPHLAEPHVHLDATQLGARTPNLSGTLREGIANWSAVRDTLTAEDVRDRALTTIRWYVAHGCTRIRTHVDTGSRVAAEALLALRDEVRTGVPGLDADGPVPVQLQVVAFPQEGILRAPGRAEAWKEIVALGCDAVGAIPHFERTRHEGDKTVMMAFGLAERRGLRVDLHCDETDDPASRHLELACAEALDRQMTAPGQVVAGHCTAMHSYPDPHAAKVVELVVQSGLTVVTNPLDNIVLQGRYDGYPRRRGHTRVDELWAAGATVGIGHDSVVDPWYRLGTANLVDAAYMLVHYAHLTGVADMHRCVHTLVTENHQCFGDVPRIAEGEAADLCWFDADDPVELLRTRVPPRVFVAGRPVQPQGTSAPTAATTSHRP